MSIFLKHSDGSSVWPRLRTTDVSLVFLSEVIFIPWVLTVDAQMLKIWKSHRSKGEDRKTLL